MPNTPDSANCAYANIEAQKRRFQCFRAEVPTLIGFADLNQA
ncbi:MAG: hypothetical protein SH820_16085 [Xanthomonadales bacterium]|nr:hypothetical protein [Xanthomonadales bacterium]